MAHISTNLTIEECDNNKAIIVALLHKTRRRGVEEVIHYLCESGFFVVSSSINRHHNWRGGLAQHCLGVYLTAKEHGEGLPEDSLIIAGLLHDMSLSFCCGSILIEDKQQCSHITFCFGY